MTRFSNLATLGAFACLTPAFAEDRAALKAPRTRTEVKRAVQVQKEATPNLPLPPEAERTRGNNGAMQRYYLPKEWQSGGQFGRQPAEKGEKSKGRGGQGGPDYAFNTQLFWIVSRTNDCRYCLGHQEVKLASAGLAEEQIARLDGDWSDVPATVKPALAYARKITLEPHLVGAADLAELKKHYAPAQVLAIVSSCAGFNRMNRWTGSLNIPQDREPFGRAEKLDAGVDPKYANVDSPTMPKQAVLRPALEPRTEVEKQLAALRDRQPHVELPTAEKFDAAAPSGVNLPIWVRAAATTPEQGVALYKNREAILSTGKIPTLLKAKIMWTTARHNRAWYALADARKRLLAQGQSADAIFALDRPESQDAATAAALTFARKLTVEPQLVGAEDFKPLKAHFGNFEVAEIVWATAVGNYFDRLTEPLGLPSDK